MNNELGHVYINVVIYTIAAEINRLNVASSCYRYILREHYGPFAYFLFFHFYYSYEKKKITMLCI